MQRNKELFCDDRLFTRDFLFIHHCTSTRKSLIFQYFKNLIMCQEGRQSLSSSWKWKKTELQTATYPCPSQMWHVSTATGLCNHITKGVKQGSISPKPHRSQWLQTNTCPLSRGQKISDHGAASTLDWTYWTNCASCSLKWQSTAVLSSPCRLKLINFTKHSEQGEKGNNPASTVCLQVSAEVTC